MKKTKTLFIGAGLFTAVITAGIYGWRYNARERTPDAFECPTNKYGAFLAAQHAIYINDFERAAALSRNLADTDLPIVRNTMILSEFLSGTLPANVDMLRDETGGAARLVYDTYLARNGDWDTLYRRHRNDTSALNAPLRIWSSVAVGKAADAIKFIDKLNTNDSWKSFARGQVYAETNKPELAAKQFEKVAGEFMNINDYLYIYAFYVHNNMTDAATALRNEFISRPGGLYMMNIEIKPDFANYAGYRNALAFSIIQNVSHTQIMLYSDLSVLLLRMSGLVAMDNARDDNAINYYLGQYFSNNGGDAEKYFKKIDKDSPYFPYADLKILGASDKISDLERAFNKNPLFIPALNKLVAKYIQNGDYKKALKAVNQALDNSKLDEKSRMFFIKIRANINLIFDNLDAAATDIRDVPMDMETLGISAKLYARRGKDLDLAYEYAVALVRKNPTDIESWNVLGMVVNAKEGTTAALDVIERVAQVSDTNSSLFEQLGDLQFAAGNKMLAKDAYLRAIDLSSDGMTIKSKIEKKIKKLNIKSGDLK